jgi:excisionase family DNA binding protein
MNRFKCEPLLLNIKEVAELTGLSIGTLYHFVSQRRIPFVRLSSRCVRFRKVDIEEWLDGLHQAPRELK